MSLEQLRALIEKYLDSKGYQNKTRSNIRSYLKKLLDFMQEHGYEELNDTVISEYMRGYETTQTIGSRKLRVEEFVKYAKGERQIDMFKENPVLSESEVLQADTDMAATGESETQSQKTEPETPKGEGGQGDTDMAASEESEGEQPDTEPATPKKKNGRPRKPAGDIRANSFSVYLTDANAEALKDLAAYERKEISVLLAEQVEKFISRNQEALIDYRTFQKNKKPLQ